MEKTTSNYDEHGNRLKSSLIVNSESEEGSDVHMKNEQKHDNMDNLDQIEQTNENEDQALDNHIEENRQALLNQRIDQDGQGQTQNVEQQIRQNRKHEYEYVTDEEGKNSSKKYHRVRVQR